MKKLFKLFHAHHPAPFSSTIERMLSLQGESFAAVGTSSSMELLPASLPVLPSAPPLLHFPSPASFFGSCLWSEETYEDVLRLLEFSPLRKEENKRLIVSFGFASLNPNATLMKLMQQERPGWYLRLGLLKESESDWLFREDRESSGLALLLDTSLWKL